MGSSPFRAGILLGLGLGGLFDGIVFHQILGWHHLICTTATCRPETVAMLEQQNRQDGWFHAAVWLLTVAGAALLARVPESPMRPRAALAGALAGWGWFNAIEGLIDHQILRIHHVRPGSGQELLYDLAFLGSGVALILVGHLWWRRRRPPTSEKP